jgi:hypothetical protein
MMSVAVLVLTRHYYAHGSITFTYKSFFSFLVLGSFVSFFKDFVNIGIIRSVSVFLKNPHKIILLVRSRLFHHDKSSIAIPAF